MSRWVRRHSLRRRAINARFLASGQRFEPRASGGREIGHLNWPVTSANVVRMATSGGNGFLLQPLSRVPSSTSSRWSGHRSGCPIAPHQLSHPKQTQVRLSRDPVAQLITSYQAGSTLEEVAAEFGVYVRTAAAHLERQGVPQRRHRLTPDQVAEAVGLYEAGWSTIQIGQHFGVYPESIRYRLMRAGVHMRPRSG